MYCRALALAVSVLPALALAGGAPQGQGFSFKELYGLVNDRNKAVDQIRADLSTSLSESVEGQSVQVLCEFSKNLSQQTKSLTALVTQAMSSLATVPYLLGLDFSLYKFSLKNRALWDQFRDPSVYKNYLVEADVAVTLDNAMKHGEMVAGAQEYFYVYRCLQSVFYSMGLRRDERSFKYLDQIPTLFRVSGEARRMSCLVGMAERLPEEQAAPYLATLLPGFISTLGLARKALLSLPDLSTSDITLVDAVIAMNNKDAVQELLRSLCLFQKYGAADAQPALNAELVAMGEVLAKVLDTVPACTVREPELALVGALVWLANDESDLAKASFSDANADVFALANNESGLAGAESSRSYYWATFVGAPVELPFPPSTTGVEFKSVLSALWRVYKSPLPEGLEELAAAMGSDGPASAFAFEHAIGLINRAMPFEIAGYLAPKQYMMEGWPEPVEATAILAKMVLNKLVRRCAEETGKWHGSEWFISRLLVKEVLPDIYYKEELGRVGDRDLNVDPVSSLRAALGVALKCQGGLDFVLHMNDVLLNSLELARAPMSRQASAAPHYYLLSNACNVLAEIEKQLSERVSKMASQPDIQDCSERFATWDLYLRARQAVSMVQEQIRSEISLAVWERPSLVDHRAYYQNGH